MVVTYTFNPSTQDRGRQISVSSKPVWSTKQVPGQDRLQSYIEKPCLKGEKKGLNYLYDTHMFLSCPVNLLFLEQKPGQ